MEENVGKRLPGGQISNRPLYYFFVADCSGSMSVEGKIETLNHAVKDAIPHMIEVARENPNAQILIRALRFSSGAQWHINEPVPVEEFEWTDLSAGGVTDMGAAFDALAEQLKIPPMPPRALPPVILLLSDGMPTDDYGPALRNLLKLPWAQKAVRLAIGIGRDRNMEVLQRFIDNPEIHPFEANNPEQLVKFIKWATTVPVKAASSPASQVASAGGASTSNVPLVMPADTSDNSPKVW
ncbi:MAG: vWA domain-containing protein [Myxococcota bacterium]|mgnify:CR=1 FL=1|jgi:uncharacterized protein YegL